MGTFVGEVIGSEHDRVQQPVVSMPRTTPVDGGMHDLQHPGQLRGATTNKVGFIGHGNPALL